MPLMKSENHVFPESDFSRRLCYTKLLMSSPLPQPVSLALQGSGTHSAFSWGVVDQLLMDERLDIKAISATSGGAMIASVIAQGMLEGGKKTARDKLHDFWRKVSVAASMLPMRTSIVDNFLSHVGVDISPSSMALDMLTKIFSPYQFNLFDINPLRGIIEEMVDFDQLNRESPVALYINATNARTGKGRIFTDKELTLDAVMASACLPFIFKAVNVDGELYWDGSFSGCPALTPLFNEAQTSDIVLVQVHPNYVEEVPTTATDILDRATEISFNAVLGQELKTIELYNQLIHSGKLDRKPVHIHTIEASDILNGLGRASKLNAEWNFLVHLHDLGVQAATDWLEKYFVSQKSRSQNNKDAA